MRPFDNFFQLVVLTDCLRVPYCIPVMVTRHTALSEAYSPDADRAGPDASATLPDWLVHLLTRIIFFLLEHGLATWRPRAPSVLSWCHDRPDLPPGSAQAEAASIRGPFGRAIEWMCRRRGLGPGHPNWPVLRCAIVAFGGSVQGFRPGLPACGLQWWENPEILPGAIGEIRPTPAAAAMARLLSRQAEAAPPPALTIVPAAAEPAEPPALRRPVPARLSTGPPTGPPAGQTPNPATPDQRGRAMAGPAILIRAAAIAHRRPLAA